MRLFELVKSGAQLALLAASARNGLEEFQEMYTATVIEEALCKPSLPMSLCAVVVSSFGSYQAWARGENVKRYLPVQLVGVATSAMLLCNQLGTEAAGVMDSLSFS